jgi:uncharacterized protein YueI
LVHTIVLYRYIKIQGQQNLKFIVTISQKYTQRNYLFLYLQLHASLEDDGEAVSETNMVTKIGVVLRTQKHVL